MSNLKPYPKYKPSDVEWLGDVPENWRRIPIKYTALNTESLFLDGDWIESKDITGNEIRYITTGNVGTGKYKEQGSGYITESKFKELNCTEVFEGDILISRLNAPIGRACIIPNLNSRIVTSVDNVIYRPDNGFSPQYLVYLLSSVPYFKHTIDLARGTTMKRISRSLLGSIRIINAPLSEQSTIATFLDRETGRIDALVEEKTRFIELLKEKRQALITQAVTKGLDPNVKMKDSGVEWIGDVPEHWEVLPIKRLVETPITDGPHETPVKHDDGIPFVSAEAVRTGVINFDKIWGYISHKENARYSKKYKPKMNDIYMVKSGATTGVTAIVEKNDGFNIWSPLAAIRANNLIAPKFLLSSLRSISFQNGIVLNWSYGTQQNIGMQTLENLPIPVPLIDEQMKIIKFIKKNVDRMNQLERMTDNSIKLLKERRSALITAAVTGKIDVRETK